MQKYAAIAFIVGPIMFLASIFMPAISGQFAATSAQEIVALIEGDRAGWILAQALFAFGMIIAGAGAYLLARHIQTLSSNTNVSRIALIGGIAVLIAGVSPLFQFYAFVTYDAEYIAEQVFSGEAGGPVMRFMFSVYTVLVLSGLIAIGYAMLKTGYSRVLAWFVMGVMALALVGFVVTGNTLPLFQYVLMVIMGIYLLLRRSPAYVTQPMASEPVS